MRAAAALDLLLGLLLELLLHLLPKLVDLLLDLLLDLGPALPAARFIVSPAARPVG